VKIRIQHYQQAYRDNGKRAIFLVDGSLFIGRSRRATFTHVFQCLSYDPSVIASVEAGKKKDATVHSLGGQ